MTIVTAVSDGSGGYKPQTWPQDNYGMDYNGSSYCFITDADLISPSSRELSAPHGRLVQLVSAPVTVPSDFFGMHFHRLYSSTQWPAGLPIACVRSHDGGMRWQEIQPNNATNYDWSRFDRWLALVEANGCTPVFTVYGSPSWASARPAEASAYSVNGLAAEPTNMADLATFVTAVANRYGSRLPYYEVWNEPNLTGFFTGTKAKLVDMVKTVSLAVKAVNPSAKIICPSVTSFRETAGSGGEVYLDALLTQQDTAATGTMLNWIDIVGVHLYYAHMTTTIVGCISRIKTLLQARGYGALELWDTESGILSPYPDVIADEFHLKIMQRRLIATAACGLEKQFWYSYDHTNMGFMSKPVIQAGYTQIVNFLAGKSITSAIQRFDGVVTVIRADGEKMTV